MSETTRLHVHEFYWYPALNEDGWRCCLCDFKPGEPPGFDPARDRDDLGVKVECILRDLNDAGIVYVSNSDHCGSVVAAAVEVCRNDDTFDQYSIALAILDVMTSSHADYWRKVSEGVLSGHDPRHRCPCGQLATVSSCTAGGWIRRCRECEFPESPR